MLLFVIFFFPVNIQFHFIVIYLPQTKQIKTNWLHWWWWWAIGTKTFRTYENILSRKIHLIRIFIFQAWKINKLNSFVSMFSGHHYFFRLFRLDHRTQVTELKIFFFPVKNSISACLTCCCLFENKISMIITMSMFRLMLNDFNNDDADDNNLIITINQFFFILIIIDD